MKNIWTIAVKEWKGYFVSPVAYIYILVFLIVTHWLFLNQFFLMGAATLRPFFAPMPLVFLFFIPAMAMGKWAEEKKQGTLELLFTLPVNTGEVVLGKFLAGLCLLGAALLLTFPLPVTVALLGELDFGPVIGGYLGLLLMGGAYLAIGLWVSSLTDNQIVAFILGVVASFLLFIIGDPLITNALPESWIPFLRYAGLGQHFDSIGRGVLDTRDLLYYLSVIGLFLFFNRRGVEKRG